ncbi:MAG: major facilitator superfamily 1 [Betaproteobacteria bacterium]|nr:major facilitator superfamily 1 [Betaproteobacteria bacterium]
MAETGTGRQRLLLYVICGGLIMGAGLGARHVQGLFLLPMTMERGFSRESFAFAVACQNLIWGLAQPGAGMLADRYGAAKVLVGGLLLYALGLWGMSAAASPLMLTLSAGLLIGCGLAGTTFGVVYGALSRLALEAHRGWALGLAGAVGGLGQFVMVPLAHGLLDGVGMAVTLLLLALMMVALLPAGIAVRESVKAAGAAQQSMRAALREAFAHRGFWMLNAGFLACGFQLAFIGTHLPAYLLDHGLNARHATIGLALIALSNTVGTYVAGVLGARARRKHLLAGLYLVRVAAMALFITLPLSPLTLYVFCVVMGFLWLGTVPLTNGIVAQVFGLRYLGTLFGFVFFGHQLGAFLGVWLGGVVYEHTHSYHWLWIGSIVLGVVAAALHWPIDDRQIARPALQPVAA